jgi:hypothetical protein
MFGPIIELHFKEKKLKPRNNEKRSRSIFIPFSFVMQLLSLLLGSKYTKRALVQRKE